MIEAAEYHAYTGGSQILIPWFMSSAGYGFLWNLPSYGNLTVAAAPGNTTFFTEAAANVDFWVTTTPAAPPPAGTSLFAPLLLQLADATGHGLPMAPYAAGFLQVRLLAEGAGPPPPPAALASCRTHPRPHRRL